MQRSINQVCRVLDNWVLAVHSRVHRVEHEVYEREVVITAVGLTRAGKTAELESAPPPACPSDQSFPGSHNTLLERGTVTL